MKKFIKVKNGFRVEVMPWDKVVTITKIETGEIVKKETFSDHIKAVMVAKAL